ncbi:tetratricopeptide repeat protein 12-like [Drosophila novamexicana]|uniref:tetratricopeptide repeat protein 12-like n=1 Tax=Drosophila novamexicana TaxID=47314 RepID=UPI0011E5ED11|nr:tetratricopeptide repeat protein 12-like [Drosophila novamexicana]
MSATRHRELEEDFLRRPSKVGEVINLLDEISKGGKMAKGNVDKPAANIIPDVTDTNFIVMQRGQLHVKTRSKRSFIQIDIAANRDQMTFMRQIDVTQAERNNARRERISVALNYRRLGNAEFRKPNFDNAIEFYTKGLEYIVDSKVLFVNRSLCYIKKRDYQRALIDLDYVLLNLDGRCLRAWLYRAGALKRMNNEAGYLECIDNARRYNHSEEQYIEYFIEKIKSGF